MRLLEGTGGGARYEGPRHFDAHAYRTEDHDGVWEFAKGCMRTYKLLAARAAAFDADPDVQAILSGTTESNLVDVGAGYSAERGAALRGLEIDAEGLGAKGLGYERLDQLMVEHMMGARG